MLIHEIIRWSNDLVSQDDISDEIVYLWPQLKLQESANMKLDFNLNQAAWYRWIGWNLIQSFVCLVKHKAKIGQ